MFHGSGCAKINKKPEQIGDSVRKLKCDTEKGGSHCTEPPFIVMREVLFCRDFEEAQAHVLLDGSDVYVIPNLVGGKIETPVP